MIRLRRIFGLFVLVVAVAASFAPASAQDNVISAAFKAPSIDLIPVLKLVKSTTPKAVIELPPGSNGSKRLMSLQARQQNAEEVNWVVFSLKNTELRQQDLVLAIPYAGFIGSGVLWPAAEGSKIRGLQVSEALKAVRLQVPSVDAIALTVPPGASLTYAIELPGESIDDVRLWRRAAFDDKSRQHAFFRGVVLGITLLIAIGISCLFIVKPQAVFPAAALFSWSAIAFIMMNTFSLPAALQSAGDLIGRAGLRAVVESLMLAGVAATFLTYLELRHKSLVAYGVLLSVLLASLALLGAAFYVPIQAQGVARLAFAATAVFGTLVTIYYWSQGSARSQSGLLPALLLSAWVTIAAVASMGLVQTSILLPITTVGLVLVLVTIALSLLPVAFGNAIGSAFFMQDAGRRALALAGSEMSVWDWNIENNQLYIGPEVERALGVPNGSVAAGGINAWAGLVHPADKSAYFAAVESAERRGRGHFRQSFRLRRSDGTYRWYQLRARAINGANGASRLIGTLCDITAQKRAEDSILVDAVHDRVTGLPNRALFIDRLSAAIQRSLEAPGTRICVVVIDLDRFRSVNERLGHEVGDSLLSVTARRIALFLSPGDTLARLPGNQFAVLLEDTANAREVGAFCEQLRDTLAQPVNLRPQEVYVTASMGIALLGDPRQLPAELLKDAEVALYEAKRRGQQMIQFFTPDMRADPVARTVLENELEGAVERGEIVVFYQPIQRIPDGQLAGFEALVRWNHPIDGLREPATFIPFAEQTGLIKPIGHFVLLEAVRQLGIWQRAFRPTDPLFVTVNISSEQLLDFALVNDVKVVLTREGIAPQTLKLELTETLAMQNIELSMQILQQIKDLGVGLACDDFGTGYSALSNLRRLPFDTLKLDREFLESDADAEKSEIILESLILMAHDLELDVVVEGVENSDQLEQLQEFECDFAQGFFIGGPVSPQHVIEALGSVPYSQQTDGKQAAATWEMLRGASQPDTVFTPDASASTAGAPGPTPGATGRPQPAARQMQLNLEPDSPISLSELSACAAEDSPCHADSVWPADDEVIAIPARSDSRDIAAAGLSDPDAKEPDATASVKPPVGDIEPRVSDASDIQSPSKPDSEPEPKQELPELESKLEPPEPEPAKASCAPAQKPATSVQPRVNPPAQAKTDAPTPKAEKQDPSKTCDADGKDDADKTSGKTGPAEKSKPVKAVKKTPAASSEDAKTSTSTKAAKTTPAKKTARKRVAKNPLAKKLRRAAKTRARKQSS